MRCVALDGRNGPLIEEDLRNKLAGHLHARLAEYGEEGVRVSMTDGTVLVGFPGRSGQQAACLLEEQGVFALAEEERVRFLIGPGVSFEDLDYVQSAAAELL